MSRIMNLGRELVAMQTHNYNNLFNTQNISAQEKAKMATFVDPEKKGYWEVDVNNVQALGQNRVNTASEVEKKEGRKGKRSILFPAILLVNILVLLATLIVLVEFVSRTMQGPMQAVNVKQHWAPAPIITGVTERMIGSCSDAERSGVYRLELLGDEMLVYCSVDSHGKYTVVQRRIDGRVGFLRSWAAYKEGFGSVAGEFWLGNDNIHLLTALGLTRLRVDLEDWDNNTYTVYYNQFSVADESGQYRLSVGQFVGEHPPGDCLSVGDGRNFTTYDRDNDLDPNGNCALKYFGGWWYNWCHDANPNGLYNSTTHGTGLNWRKWKGYFYSLKAVAMMVSKPE